MKTIVFSLIRFIIYKKDSLPTYYGIGEHLLDHETLKYRMFGAVWKCRNGRRYVIGYWFGDTEDEVLDQIKFGKRKNLIKQNDQLLDVYQSFFEKQKRELWHKRINLSDQRTFQEKWNRKEPGWYLIKSSNRFPCSISCIHKTKHSLWLEHICICESKNDVKRSINKINLEHKIHLKL